MILKPFVKLNSIENGKSFYLTDKTECEMIDNNFGSNCRFKYKTQRGWEEAYLPFDTKVVL